MHLEKTFDDTKRTIDTMVKQLIREDEALGVG